MLERFLQDILTLIFSPIILLNNIYKYQSLKKNYGLLKVLQKEAGFLFSINKISEESSSVRNA